ncbi:Cyclin [Macrophomina phaseolina MS6]|uniref:RNA polymerase II holoenzyme cyclin-like subunit n=2 Tax=Macrophomina phaseolina TaxID=35725 RepID=K2RXH6_MACPH|nr:Cyclin [Macrophomina phaseolina MS6]KAH7027080.1 cyclin-like protein [Macrophomina phaseolina]
MSASYWSSTQRRFWTYSKPELAQIRRSLEDENKELVQKYPLPDRRLLHVYFCSQLNKLVRRLKLSQQAVATAQVYIRRVYTKIEIRRTNPNLVIVTALYLACKMEESPQHIRMILGEARQAWQDIILPDTSKLGECEFSLISEMNSQLIIHHPYRSLSDLQTSFKLTHEEYSQAEYVLNDHYLTDLPLLHPPHVIAIASMVIAVTLGPTQTGISMLTAANMQTAMSGLSNQQAGNAGGSPVRMQHLMNWLADSNVDIEAVADCVQEMVSLYEVWEQYNEKVCKDQINRFIRARGLEK